MAYLGNDLQVAYQSYQIIDDISSSFNGVLTTFPLQVGGVTPVPFPINPQQCLISVNGVIQEPDPSGTSGFNLVGSNIVFSSAPTGGHAFFGVILAGADYVNVGVNYPSGSESAPSITFDTDLDTGIYNPGDNELGFSTNSVQRLKIESDGDINIDSGGVFYDATNNRLGIGSTSPNVALTVGSGAVSTGAVVPTNDIAFPSAYANGFFRAVGNYNAGAGTGGTIQLGGKSYTDAPNVGAFLISAVSASNVTNALTISTQTSFSNVVSERLRIDNSGRLLVGTSSAPSTGGWNQYAKIVNQGNTGGAANGGVLAMNRGIAATSMVADQQLGVISFGDSAGNEFGTIICQADAQPGNNDYPGRLVFSTTADGASSPTERMRITSGGVHNVFSSVSSTFLARSSAAANTSNQIIQGAHSATNTTNGTISFIVYTNGNVENTNNSYGQISDIKLKENIADANSQWDDLKAVRVRNFNFKKGQTHRQIGVIAQELEEVSPGLVYETPDRDEDGNETGEVTKGVSYSLLYMKAVKALQEAMERIETLEAKVAALEAA